MAYTRIVVLGGAGAMGRGTVRDLVTSAPEIEVVIADRDGAAAAREVAAYPGARVRSLEVDAHSVSQLAELLSGADVCVNSTIHDLNLTVMQACIEARCHYNDLGGLFFMSRRQVLLDEEFRHIGRSAVLGIGSSPGTMNMLACWAADRLDTVEKANALCAFSGKAFINGVFVPPYALQTLIEEFAVPPPEFIDGEWRTVAPASGEEVIDFFEPLGRVACHYVLHSEPFHFATSFAEKGIREATFKLGPPPDLTHVADMLVRLGFDRKNPISVNGQPVDPLAFLNALVRSRIESSLRPEDMQLDVVNVIRADVSGAHGGRPRRYLVDAICRPHPEWPDVADAATSIPPSICAQMQASGAVPPGAAGPERMLNVRAYFDALLRRPGTSLRVTQQAEPDA